MFKYLKSVFLDRSIRNRILFVLFILAITRVLSAIPMPSISGADLAEYVNNTQFLSFLNIFTGGGLSSLSIMMLGVGPYITASIIMQLMTVLVPSVKKMQQEEGEAGRRKFAQYSRWLTPPLAVLQALGYLVLFSRQGLIPEMSSTTMALNIMIVTAGSVLMMWLGEMINEKGIGNGISLLIFSGIVASLPSTLKSIWETTDPSQYPLYFALFIIFIVTLLLIVIFTEGERPLPVTYAKQSRNYASADNFTTTTYLPLRLTQAGVIPIIFAVSLLMFPQLIAQLLVGSGNSMAVLIANAMLTYLGNSWIYGAVYFLLVVLFTFFYTAVTFDPIKTAENLQKSGAFISGVRPGEPTTAYISDVLMRVTAIGALFLGFAALLPIILSGVTGVALTIGGTSLLIAVSVVIDLIKKIDAQVSMKQY